MSEAAAETVTPDSNSPTGRESSSRPAGRARTRHNHEVGQVIPLFMIGMGIYLAWFAIHYWRDQDVKWPTDPIKAALTGKGIPAANHPPSWESIIANNASAASNVSGTGPTPGGDTGASNATAAQNQATGKLLAAQYGWSTGNEWDSLVKLWNRESGWDNKAKNPSSGAYGIPQALPQTKMPKGAQEPPVGNSDPTLQIQWGLSYIKERYVSPSAAWAHETSVGWY